MNTASNISAMQVSGGANTPQTQAAGQSSGQGVAQSSQGMFAFLEAFLQLMQGGGAQNMPQGLNGLAEKIAGLLKKDGISADQLQNMSPQDLASKIQTLLQQQNISLPPSLQNISASDLATQLASQLQQNAGATGSLNAGLTSGQASAQTDNLQNLQGETKQDIARKISTMLEQQQQIGASTLTPVQFHELKVDFAQLQSAPGTVDAATMSQLTTDLTGFLQNQGVDQASLSKFMGDLTQALQPKDQTASAPAQTGVQPGTQQANTNANSDASLNSDSAGIHTLPQQNPQTWQNFSAKNFIQQSGDKTPILGGKNAPILGTDSSPAQLSNALTQQQTPSLPQSGDLTAKITGMGINPALINDLAGGDGSAGSGFSGGFGQNSNAQQSQDLTGSNALLQPMTADMLQNQNFTNFLNGAPATAQNAQPSPTTQLVNVQIQNNINAGINTMTLQLEPADLGKMNVKLSFAKDGTIKAHMTVDKPETLALLQKDSSHLQRALQQSGLTTDENSLSFDLRQQSQHQNFSGYNGSGGNNDDGEFGSHIDGGLGSALQAQLAIQSSGYITPSGVNIMV